MVTGDRKKENIVWLVLVPVCLRFTFEPFNVDKYPFAIHSRCDENADEHKVNMPTGMF